jgi:hypothetical protein
VAEYNQGVTGLGREILLYRKNIADVVYVRCFGNLDLDPRYVGYISLGVGFGEESDKRIYEICGAKLWGNAIAIYPPFESRLATNDYCVTAFWRIPGITWNLNSY